MKCNTPNNIVMSKRAGIIARTPAPDTNGNGQIIMPVVREYRRGSAEDAEAEATCAHVVMKGRVKVSWVQVCEEGARGD